MALRTLAAISAIPARCRRCACGRSRELPGELRVMGRRGLTCLFCKTAGGAIRCLSCPIMTTLEVREMHMDLSCSDVNLEAEDFRSELPAPLTRHVHRDTAIPGAETVRGSQSRQIRHCGDCRLPVQHRAPARRSRGSVQQEMLLYPNDAAAARRAAPLRPRQPRAPDQRQTSQASTVARLMVPRCHLRVSNVWRQTRGGSLTGTLRAAVTTSYSSPQQAASTHKLRWR